MCGHDSRIKERVLISETNNKIVLNANSLKNKKIKRIKEKQAEQHEIAKGFLKYVGISNRVKITNPALADFAQWIEHQPLD